MKIQVDSEFCTGHGRCAANAPDVYVLDDDGFCISDGKTVLPSLQMRAQLGADNCPEGAITLVPNDEET
jgi:ferredoxin